MKEQAVSESGATHEQHVEATSEDAAVEGLKLSPIKFVSVDELTASGFNSVFDELKTDTYWEDLTRDIRESGVITDPLLVTRENEILAGHSRHQIARTLRDDGDTRFETVPVRYIQNDLDDGEKTRRGYLSNYNRFEIDSTTRLLLRARIYPDYYTEEPQFTGRPRKDSSETAGRKRRTSPAQIARDNQVSKRAIQKEREIYQAAGKIAQAAGRDEPTTKDLDAAKKAKKARTTARSAAARTYSATQIRDALKRYVESERDEAKCAGAREFVEGVLGNEE